MAYSLGDIVHARTALARALALAHDTGEMAIAALAEYLLGRVEFSLGNVHLAREHFPRSLEQFRELPIAWGVGSSLTGMATVHLAAGDTTPAEHLLEEAASLLRPVGPWFLALALDVRAILAVRRGNADETIAIVRESLRLIRWLHDNHASVFALGPLAVAAVLKGDETWAARILGARDAVTERTHATVVVRQALDNPHRTGGTRAVCPPWARSVGPRVCIGTHRLHRFGAERHRSRLSECAAAGFASAERGSGDIVIMF